MKIRNKFSTQRGIGLIELMVSITIGLFVMAGVLQLYLTSTQNVSTFEGSSRIQENARYAFALFAKDIGQAGNMGCFSAAFVTEPHLRILNVLGENSGAGERYDFASFISGEDDAGPGSSGGTSTDKLIVRYADATSRFPVLGVSETSAQLVLSTAAAQTISVGQVLAVGDCSTLTFFSASSVNTSTGVVEHAAGTATESGAQYNTTASLGPKYVSANPNTTQEGMSFAQVYAGETGAVVYEIGDSAAGSCGSSTPQYCALRRNGVEIVEGVEDLQVDYGWIDNNGILKFVAADVIEAAGNSEEIWRLIDRVRITATFNSINTATTNEGLGLLSRTYSQVFVVQNQLPASI